MACTKKILFRSIYALTSFNFSVLNNKHKIDNNFSNNDQ